MLAKSRTCAVVGLDGYIVEVEVDISPGLPAFKKVATQTTDLIHTLARIVA